VKSKQDVQPNETSGVYFFSHYYHSSIFQQTDVCVCVHSLRTVGYTDLHYIIVLYYLSLCIVLEPEKGRGFFISFSYTVCIGLIWLEESLSFNIIAAADLRLPLSRLASRDLQRCC